MPAKFDSILKKALENVEPSKEDIDLIENSLKDFKEKFVAELKKQKINAEFFVGGSFAKKTLIKKDNYDVDVFIRFNSSYKDEEISSLTKKVLEKVSSFKEIHGSRLYFSIKIKDNFFIELVPVIKVNNPEKAENTTDLSYLHVKYIRKKVKEKKLLDEIRIAKAFCFAHHCYGAESYINGFSGYGLELLVYNYGSFIKFLREIIKVKKDEKLVIDVEKHYKNKKTILLDLNSSKLESPIVFIDPTYKQRNILAALSQETLERFQKAASDFLQKPSLELFKEQKTDLDEIKKQSDKNKDQFILLQAKTDRQEGDIAGSKLLKFYNHLSSEISKFFDLKNKGFNYNQKQSARYFFVVKPKKEILFEGPFVKDEKNIQEFKKIHKSYFTKKGKIFAKESAPQDIKEFLEEWQKKDKRKMNEMSIKGFTFIED